MITTKKELKFYILADRIMNGGGIKNVTLKQRILQIIYPNCILEYLTCMRKADYYSNQKGLFNQLMFHYHYRHFKQLSLKLGFTLPYKKIGYGLVLHHPGTIICGNTNTIGNFANINTSTCIESCNTVIGDFFFMGACSCISKQIVLGDNVKLSSGSKCNKSVEQPNVVLAGQPAKIVKADDNNWIEGYQHGYPELYNEVIRLKKLLLG